MDKADLTFIGAARTVTGSATLLEYNGKRILVDCGMFQGPKEIRSRNWNLYTRDFVSQLDAVVLTHAHVDHSAMIPKIYQLGFRKPVYCTRGTMKLAEVLLPDTAYLQEEDFRRMRKSNGDTNLYSEPLYSAKEATDSLKLFFPLERNEWFELSPGLSFQFLRAGHILGSSIVQFSLSRGNGVKLVSFTGDLGNHRQKVIKGPEDLFETDELVLESTYGDRIQSRKSPEDEIAAAIRSVYQSGGALLIPAFAVGRTQEILFMIRNIFSENQAPKLDVFLDSPMALEATDLYLQGSEDLREIITEGKLVKPLCPPQFERVQKLDESIRLVGKKGPLIIISAAGMLTGGRILYHLKERLPDKKSILLFVGYQAEETKGRLLQQGLKTIRLHKELVNVRAQIKTVESLSAHADSDEIIDWVTRIEKKPKRIFLNHGDLVSSRALAYRLKHELGIKSVIPKPGERFKLF